MANNEIFMDVPAVQNMSSRFNDIGEVLKGVSNVLEVCMTILKTTAFIGLVGGMAVERFISTLKPIIDKLSAESLELGHDLAEAATAYQNGDAIGGTRFH